jgi:hypothetical protein
MTRYWARWRRHFGWVAAGNGGMVDGGGRRKEAVDRIGPSTVPNGNVSRVLAEWNSRSL